MPDASGGSAGTGAAGDDPQGAFDKSLGDFDGAIARERDAMASAGKGSGKAAEGREAGDASAVKNTGGGGSGRGGSAAGTDATDMGGEPADTSADKGGSGAEGAGPGQTEVKSGAEGSGAKGQQQEGTAAAEIPADIPADGSGEDQVARQLREAAMAEKDPVVREALWEQYRRHTGIKK
jgi:hypothetical protein